jgi:hypothetical protein
MTMTPTAHSPDQRAADARRRERRSRASAREKRDRGEGLLACLFERSADRQAALARLAEGVIGDDQRLGLAARRRALTAATLRPQP